MGGRVITEELLSMSGQGDIQIIPVATGSLPAVVGLLTSGFATEVAGFLVANTFLTSVTAVAGVFTAVGTSMIIGGITDLLAPQNPIPTTSSVSDIDPAIRGSYSFSGIQNVSSSGVPIPILYGYVYSGSIIISSGTDSTQIVKSIT